MKSLIISPSLLLVLLCQVLLITLALASSPPINVIVVGGSSGMGKAAAIAIVQRGGKALLISRSTDKLSRAEKEVAAACCHGGSVSTASLDVTDEEAVKEFAQKIPNNEWNALVVSCAGRAPHGPITELPISETRCLFESKFWGSVNCSKYFSPKLKREGSITFVSGVLNRRPGINCSPLAATNGALEGLTRSLALELGPRLRVNCLSPGFCNTERFEHMDTNKRDAMLANTAASLPLQKVGRPHDMGEAIYYLATAPFVTGVVLDVDGGHSIRQYANVNTDPMRNKSVT